MKRMVCAVMALLLTGCAAGQVQSSAPVTDGQPAATPETAATAETAESAATPVPTTAPPQGLVPTDADVLDYDDIRLIGYERAFQPYPETDYYTMCKDGLVPRYCPAAHRSRWLNVLLRAAAGTVIRIIYLGMRC